MTDQERRDEGAEEAIEDLEAPAGEQDDVAGGRCHKPTKVDCRRPTCTYSDMNCGNQSKVVIVE